MTSEQQEIREAKLARARNLQTAGFVHVTGLKAWRIGGDSYEIQACKKDLGHWDCNNGKMVLVLTDGEVWLGAGILPQSLHMDLYCPNGSKGTFVPCSNGEEIDTHSLLRRVVNPYDDSHGSPIPQVWQSR